MKEQNIFVFFKYLNNIETHWKIRGKTTLGRQPPNRHHNISKGTTVPSAHIFMQIWPVSISNLSVSTATFPGPTLLS